MAQPERGDVNSAIPAPPTLYVGGQTLLSYPGEDASNSAVVLELTAPGGCSDPDSFVPVLV